MNNTITNLGLVALNASRGWIILSIFLVAYIPLQGQHMFVRDFYQDVYNAGQNYQIAQDEYGVIYLANGDGVLMYDGAEWNLLYLPGNLGATALAVDYNDNIYVGSARDFGYYAKDARGIYQYKSLIYKLEPEHRNVGMIHEIKLFNNSVLFCDEQHIYIYQGEHFKVLNIKTDPFKSLFVVGNHLYISSLDNKFYEYTKKGIRLIKKDPSISVWSITPYKQNKAILLDNQNRLWVFDTNAPDEKRWEPFPGNYRNQLGNEKIVAIKYLQNGLVALFTIHNIIFIKENGEIYSDVAPDFTEGYYYQDALLDTEHNLWVVSPHKISHISTSSPLLYMDSNDGFKGQILSIFKKGDYEYLGTDWGLYYRKGKTAFKVFPGTYSAEAWDFYCDDNHTYAASSFGIFELNGDNATKIINHDYAFALCVLKKDTSALLMSTAFGTGMWLLKKRGDTWTKTKIKEFDRGIDYMYEDSEQNIWASNLHKGIWKLRLNSQKDSVVEQEFYDEHGGLPSNLNNRLYKLNSGEIVVSTTNGIYSYSKDSNRFITEDIINQPFEESVCIYAVEESTEGDIYFWGSISPEEATAGILKKQPNGQYYLPTTPFKKIAEKTRKNSVGVKAPIFIVSQEEIWIGSKNRLITYNAEQETYYDQPIHLRIRKVWDKDSLVYSYGQKGRDINIPYSRNNLHFEFTSTFHESAEENTYQYKLAGFEDTWSAWSHSTKTNFTNLPEGKYAFTVRTKNIYGNISKPVQFKFYINAPWYRTYWAYISYFLLITLLVCIVVRAKTKKVERQKMLLEKEVKKKTGELLAMNEHIYKNNIEIARQAEELKELNFTKDKIFSVISHDLRGSVKQIPELLNLFDSGYITHDEFKSCIPALKEASKNLSSLTDNLLHWAKSQMKGIEVSKSHFRLIDIVEETIRLTVSQAEKKKLQLICTVDNELKVFADKDLIRLLLRNLIGNAVKFTPEKGKITISSQVIGHLVHISVTDTGVGLSSEDINKILSKEFFSKHGTSGERGSGIGLMLCREFTELHGGSLTIEGIQGKGSTFTFTILYQPESTL
ncbi:ATP-binding protein [Fulvivirga ulvae]|uniref:sensor histidine kinase n=1 Tax=Fulvivirga ulvae TaxID=2904245 RepID=UPI001F34323D|nr:ATP-binding protein [Fulvivirga ulvae]UII33108.1 ATP-binding protein [Fulvivirga ulvae]